MKAKIHSKGNKLYIGDIAYIMCPDVKDGAYGPEYKCGEQEVEQDGEILKFFSYVTSNNKDLYKGSSGKAYLVESNTLGVCPVELFGKGWFAKMEACGRTGRRVEAPFVTIEEENGIFKIWDAEDKLIEVIDTTV